MIPYFKYTTVSLGPVTLYVWGLFVALGIFVAVLLARRLVRKKGISEDALFDSALCIIIAGFIGARLGHVLLYDPRFYFFNPLEILKIWHGGMSSVGGFLLSTIVGVWYLRKKKIHVWQYADVAALSLPIGWMIGRIGCFMIHDHPGTLTHFALAVREPGLLGEAGWGRHDLGLYDAFAALGIAIIVFSLRNKKMFDGALMLVVLGLYALIRFFLDFLRATDISGADVRYGGLTPAQYGMVFALAFVIFAWYKKKAKRTGEFA